MFRLTIRGLWAHKLRFALTMPETTDPGSTGGTCEGPDNCSNHFQVSATFAANETKTIDVAFAALQPSWIGSTVTFDKSKLLQFVVVVLPAADNTIPAYEVTLDNLVAY